MVNSRLLGWYCTPVSTIFSYADPCNILGDCSTPNQVITCQQFHEYIAQMQLYTYIHSSMYAVTTILAMHAPHSFCQLRLSLYTISFLSSPQPDSHFSSCPHTHIFFGTNTDLSRLWLLNDSASCLACSLLAEHSSGPDICLLLLDDSAICPACFLLAVQSIGPYIRVLLLDDSAICPARFLLAEQSIGLEHFRLFLLDDSALVIILCWQSHPPPPTAVIRDTTPSG
jgi:hypothetical protein